VSGDRAATTDRRVRRRATVTQADKMRKADKEITDRDELYRILDEALVVHLGMVDDGQPYVVPLNFARAATTFSCTAPSRVASCAVCATTRASASRSPA
jgi:hypothetical protein